MNSYKNLLIILFILQGFAVHAQNWQQLSDFPGDAIDDGTGFIIGDSAYFGTGVNTGFIAQGTFYGMDLTTETWFSIASLQNGNERQYASGFTGSNQKGYLFGGYNGSDFLNDLWMYDPLSNTWTELSPLPSFGRSGASCFVIADTAYIIGGRTQSDLALNEVWAFDLTSGIWSQKQNLPFGYRWRASAATIIDKGYLIFGRDDASVYHNGLYEYDPIIDSWSLLNYFPSIGRTYATMFVLQNDLFIGFGLDSLGNSHNDLWKYKSTVNEWIAIPGIPTVGRRGGIALANNYQMIYSTGIDEDNTRLVETWKYAPFSQIDDTDIDNGRVLIKIVDMMGKEVIDVKNKVLLYHYSDGSVERKYQMIKIN